MLPVDAAPASETTDWTPELNHRGCDLIDKKITIGVTPAEEQEFATLTAGLRRFVERVAPLPLEHARQLHQELLEKAAAADSRS
jgi:hypothetical protein